MIEPVTALFLVGFGGIMMLVGVTAGTILHNRWIDRKLAPKKPIVVLQPPKGTP